MFGMLDQKGFEEVAKPLGLASLVKPGGSYDEVKNKFNNGGRQVVLFSTVDLEPSGTGELNHCCVLAKMDENGFRIWPASQCVGEFTMDFAKADWSGKNFQGAVFE